MENVQRISNAEALAWIEEGLWQDVKLYFEKVDSEDYLDREQNVMRARDIKVGLFLKELLEGE